MSAKDMVPQPEPSDRRDVRVSRFDRDRVVEILNEAAVQERLTFDEFEHRLGLVYSATTVGNLESVVADLPSPKVPDRRIVGTPGSALSVGTLSLARRSGPWVVASTHTSIAIWGGTQLDLSQARFAEPYTVIRAFVYLGAIEIIVPEDITVHLGGIGLLGNFYGDAPEGPPGCPVVRVTGVAIWGTVRLTRKTSTESPE
jgi:hypothetical protein